MGATVVLDLSDLQAGIPALTEALGRVHAEAAAICLELRGHQQDIRLFVRKVEEPEFALRWPVIADQVRRAYNDLQRATEMGACGIAILLVRNIEGMTAIEQSRKGTGFDYWLSRDNAGEVGLPFQNAARLEVSGILDGSDSQFETRLKQKLRQTETSDETCLPAYAVIVEFGRPQAEVAKR